MTIKVECQCGKHLTAPDTAAGKKGRCPTCGRVAEIPQLQEQLPPVEGAPSDDQGPIQATCLIVEGDRAYRAVLGEMFEQHGYRILHTTGDGAEAVGKARELKPEVVVVDVKLRPMSGFKVIQALTDPTDPRNAGVWQAIFVMLAPEIRGRDKQYALSLGVEIYVQKPFAPASVFPRIARRLRQRERR